MKYSTFSRGKVYSLEMLLNAINSFMPRLTAVLLKDGQQYWTGISLLVTWKRPVTCKPSVKKVTIQSFVFAFFIKYPASFHPYGANPNFLSLCICELFSKLFLTFGLTVFHLSNVHLSSFAAVYSLSCLRGKTRYYLTKGFINALVPPDLCR